MNTKFHNNYINCSQQTTSGKIGRETPVFAISGFLVVKL